MTDDAREPGRKAPNFLLREYLVRLTPLKQGVSYSIGVHDGVANSDQSLEYVTSDARDYLRQVGHRFTPVSVEVVAAVNEHVAEELTRVAREHEVDLIAMASHGHTGLARLVMGNHVEHVIRSGVAPVMVVRPANLHHH